MGDLKTFWQPGDYPAPSGVPEPALKDVGDLSGGGVISRGSDPNSEGGRDGDAAIKNFWEDGKQVMPENPDPDTSESSNSVSGLPALPNRYEPADKNIEDVPDLTTRSPGTIDEQ